MSSTGNVTDVVCTRDELPFARHSVAGNTEESFAMDCASPRFGVMHDAKEPNNTKTNQGRIRRI
jgi:hypothetical protein